MAMRLSKSIVGEAEAQAVRDVIVEDGYLGMGAVTRRFEQELAAYLGVEAWQVISVNSGTAALHLAVQTIFEQEKARGRCKAAEKAQILAPSLTFVSSFQAITAAGCEPVACDVLPETGTLNLKDAEKRITDRTIAVMHVDYASNPWHLDDVYSFATRHGLRVIDDAAHAFGCQHHGRKIGSFGDLVCFSFDGIKNITCGEGGCLIAFEKEAAQLAADARLLAVEGDTSKRFSGARSWDPDVARQGWRYHLSNIMAAIGSVQLKRLESEFIPARRELYEEYKKHLAGAQNIFVFRTDPEDFIVPHIMPVRILKGKKEQAAKALEEAQIPYGLHYKPAHLLSFFGGGKPALAVAEQLYRELVTLPLHPGLENREIGEICAILKKAVA